MSEPRRLIDDPETPESAREGLRETAEAAEPYDVDAGLRRLTAVLAAGGATAASGTAAAATAGSSLGKIGLAVALAGALAGGGGLVYQVWGPGPEDDRGATPVEVDPAPAIPDESAVGTERSEEAPSASEPASGEVEASEPENDPLAAGSEASEPENDPEAASTEAPARERARGSAGAPASVSASDRLREETLHLARVRSALERSPREALRLAREGQQRFPDGVFEEERRALIVMALDRSGQRDRARRAAIAFIERYPNGPLTTRVREISERP